MTAPLVVPFNFSPISVSVKTSSYTIPPGKYAKVDVQCVSGGTFTINSNTALSSFSWSVLASDNMSVGPVYNPTASDTARKLDTGSTTYTNSSTNFVGSAFNENTAYDSQTHSYFLPSGTVINGTGTWRAVVSEYNDIT